MGDVPSRQKQANNHKKGLVSENTQGEPNYFIKATDFKILGLLGTGSNGSVYLVEHIRTKKVFALKQHNDKTSKYLRTKYNISSLCKGFNPFIIEIFGFIQNTENNRLATVMTCVRGGDMYNLLSRLRVLSLKAARLFCAELVIALSYLHANGIVYRDIKPENILLTSTGHIRLADFDCIFVRQQHNDPLYGSQQDDDPTCFSHTLCGTLGYIAPEVLKQEPYGFAVDWWGLGIVLYEMLVGRQPFHSKNLQKLQALVLEATPVFPTGFNEVAKDLICKLLTKDKRQRLGYFKKSSKMEPEKSLYSSISEEKGEIVENDEYPRSILLTEGALNVAKHPFFAGIDWKMVYDRSYNVDENVFRVTQDNQHVISELIEGHKRKREGNEEEARESIAEGNNPSSAVMSDTRSTSSSESESNQFSNEQSDDISQEEVCQMDDNTFSLNSTSEKQGSWCLDRTFNTKKRCLSFRQETMNDVDIILSKTLENSENSEELTGNEEDKFFNVKNSFSKTIFSEKRRNSFIDPQQLQSQVQTSAKPSLKAFSFTQYGQSSPRLQKTDSTTDKTHDSDRESKPEQQKKKRRKTQKIEIPPLLDQTYSNDIIYNKTISPSNMNVRDMINEYLDTLSTLATCNSSNEYDTSSSVGASLHDMHQRPDDDQRTEEDSGLNQDVVDSSDSEARQTSQRSDIVVDISCSSISKI